MQTKQAYFVIFCSPLPSEACEEKKGENDLKKAGLKLGLLLFAFSETAKQRGISSDALLALFREDLEKLGENPQPVNLEILQTAMDNAFKNPRNLTAIQAEEVNKAFLRKELSPLSPECSEKLALMMPLLADTGFNVGIKTECGFSAPEGCPTIQCPLSPVRQDPHATSLQFKSPFAMGGQLKCAH